MDDQIDYVQILWDQVAARPSTVPVPQWHQEVLDQRLADLARSPDEGIPWDAFQAELQSGDDKKRR